MRCGVHQYIDRFFKGTSHERARILSIDTVARNGHQVTFGRHDVTQQGQMSIIDVQTIEIQHKEHFFFDAATDSLNAEDGENLANVIGGRSGGVDVTFGEYPHEGGTVSFQ